ncbi:MAG: SRPBCC domain-containing protein [Flavobacteriales bacterium]
MRRGRAVSDRKEGSRVLFLSAQGDGMFGVLDRVEENAFMGIKHLGMYKDGREQPEDELTRERAGAMETYTLTESAGGTDLSVAMDVSDTEAASFKKMFPEAFAIVKKLAEQSR